jgi:hypothetical protein
MKVLPSVVGILLMHQPRVNFNVPPVPSVLALALIIPALPTHHVATRILTTAE